MRVSDGTHRIGAGTQMSVYASPQPPAILKIAIGSFV